MSTPGTVGILLHPRESVGAAPLAAALARVREHGYEAWATHGQLERRIDGHHRPSLLVTIGGDGTFLYGARIAAPRGIPVLGVNRGQLGFLTDIELDALPDALDCFIAGGCRTQRRSLLGLLVPGAAPGDPPALDTLAVNEVAVKSTGVHLARIRVEADSELLGEFDADGVVIATATGSTAYALSAGGPPIDPRVRAVVVVPLAPHAVITRAVVIPEAAHLAVTVVHGRAFVTADGRVDARAAEGTRISVDPGPELRVVQVGDSPPFLRRLREKLRFGTPLKLTVDDGHGRDG